MPVREQVTAFVLRWRYAILAGWIIPWAAACASSNAHGDWIYVELGARILFHHHAPPAGGPRLAVYATNPTVQIGPPALLLVGPLEWLPAHLSAHLGVDLLSVLVIPCLWLAETAAASFGNVNQLRGRGFAVGLLVVPIWTLEAQRWGHVDDVVALLAAMGAAVLISRGQSEVLAGLILGTGAAAKPWAVILLPMLLAYSRPQVARAVMAFVLGALVWWVPFVIAAPGTVHALGSLDLIMENHPTWHLLGLYGRAPQWIRALQMLAGLALAVVFVRRAGWAAVPVVALAWRVTSDPYDWPYYVMGPLLAAGLWDLARPRRRLWAGLPWATASAVLVEFLAERELPPSAPALRLIWFLGLVLWVWRSVGQAEPSAMRAARREAAPVLAPV